ncbi:MAG: beta-ketoacyl-[acyl-carrier-protein] synthase family protein [Holophagales bacterium]|nr:beta-ketoacyl-[acyl-carrier-protein] synthase family protein [Holophagales bacterium]
MNEASERRERFAPRIVVTGLGLVTPLGVGREEVWTRLLAGESGLGPVRSFDTSRHAANLGGELHGFEARDWVRRLDPQQMGRASQLAICAARQALDDAALPEGGVLSGGAVSGSGHSAPAIPPERIGVAMGTTSGEPGLIEEFDDRYLAGELDAVGGALMGLYPCHVIAAHVAAEFDLAGPNAMLPAACAAGNYAVAYAMDALSDHRADVMLAGGADAFSRITYTGFARLGAIAPARCQPFDKNRRGMVPGEGAAFLILERHGDAVKRGASIYAEVAGYGLSCDAHHMTAAHPEGDGAARAMRQALATSGVDPSEVSYISAHGTGTPTNDKLETLAVRQVFGERTSSIPISSIKSMIGHTMGAASAIESVVCSLAIRDGKVPPTIHFEEPDPECSLDCVPNEARELDVAVAMNNAYAFGGNNASLILRRLDA